MRAPCQMGYSCRMRAAIVLALALPMSVAAQESLRPVPAAWLHGNRLEVSDLNFSIDTPPGRSWSYQKSDRATSFMAIDGEGTRYAIGVLDHPSVMLRPEDKESFLK